MKLPQKSNPQEVSAKAIYQQMHGELKYASFRHEAHGENNLEQLHLDNFGTVTGSFTWLMTKWMQNTEDLSETKV